MDGLSTAEALSRLAEVLARPRRMAPGPRRTLRPAAAIRPLVLAALVRGRGAPWAALVCAVLVAEAVVFALVARSRRGEFRRRLDAASDVVRSAAGRQGAPSAFYVEGREPPSGAVRVGRVLRDGRWVAVPQVLLVAGDVVDASGGFGYASCGPADLLPLTAPCECSGGTRRVLRAPLDAQLDVLSACPPGTRDADARALCPAEALHVVFLVLHAVAGPRYTGSAIVAAVLLLSPLAALAAQAHASARLLALFGGHAASALAQGARAAAAGFVEQDGAELDEFDEDAPPPTKHIIISRAALFRRVLASVCGKTSDLFWTHDLAEALAAMSVLAFVDREGPIALPFPLPAEMLLPAAEDAPSEGHEKGHEKERRTRRSPRDDAGESRASPSEAHRRTRRSPRDDPGERPAARGSALVFAELITRQDNPAAARAHPLLGDAPADESAAARSRRRAERRLRRHGRALGLATMAAAGECAGGRPREFHSRVPWGSGLRALGEIGPAGSACACLVGHSLGLPPGIAHAHRGPDWHCCRCGCAPGDYTQGSVAAGIILRRIAPGPADAPGEHVFGWGDAAAVLARCAYGWDGAARAVAPLSDATRRRALAVVAAAPAADLAAVGYMYAPGQPPPADAAGGAEAASIHASGDQALRCATPTHHAASACERPGRQADSPHSHTHSLNTHSHAHSHSLNTHSHSHTQNTHNHTQNIHGHPTKRLRRGDIWLGALLVGYAPKDDMQELIDDLANCGVRWVYFSPLPEAPTKAFGARLGLETSWNCCIVLGSARSASLFPCAPDSPACGSLTDRQTPLHPGGTPIANAGPSLSSKRPEAHTDDQRESAPPRRTATPAATEDESTDKSRMPRGVENVRPHLRSVDDVPLHVSLFAECDAAAAADMLEIYAEFGESAVAVCSALNWTAPAVAAHARLAVCMAPRDALVGPDGRPAPPASSSLALAAHLGSLAAPLAGLSFDSSPYIFTELVREGRRLETAKRSAARALASLAVSLVLASVLCACAGLDFPPLAALCVLALALTATHAAGPCEPDIMRLMPLAAQSVSGQASAASAHPAPAVTREAVQLLLRALLSALALLLARVSGSARVVLLRGAPAFLPLGERGPVCAALLGVCASQMHATLPAHVYGPLQNGLWSALAGLAMAWAVIRDAVSHRACFALNLTALGSAIVLVARLVLAFCAGLAGNEAVKALWWRAEVERGIKRARLQFNTRLGMHSPV